MGVPSPPVDECFPAKHKKLLESRSMSEREFTFFFARLLVHEIDFHVHFGQVISILLIVNLKSTDLKIVVRESRVAAIYQQNIAHPRPYLIVKMVYSLFMIEQVHNSHRKSAR